MHVPDGMINLPVSAAAGVVAAGAVAVSLRGARRELGDGPLAEGHGAERTAPSRVSSPPSSSPCRC